MKKSLQNLRNCSRLSCDNFPFSCNRGCKSLPKSMSHSTLNFLHPLHGNCAVLTPLFIKRLRRSSPGNPQGSKSPIFLYRCYSISFKISVAGLSPQCSSCSQNQLMAPSYTIKFKSGTAILSHDLQPHHVQ